MINFLESHDGGDGGEEPATSRCLVGSSVSDTGH